MQQTYPLETLKVVILVWEYCYVECARYFTKCCFISNTHFCVTVLGFYLPEAFLPSRNCLRSNVTTTLCSLYLSNLDYVASNERMIGE
jgi:hypothetical protein